MIETLGKGAVRSTTKHHRVLPAAAEPVDWTKGSGLPRPRLIDQDQADCCVACAFSYYHWQLKGIEFSRRDLFARIALQYGAEIVAGAEAIVAHGQQTLAECPDPTPETPANMRDKSVLNAAKELEHQELEEWEVSNDIDSIASAILAYKGVGGGLEGTNEGWHNLTVPEPPKPGDSTVWGHALYFVDFHIHTNPDGTTEKCIIAVTSWPNAGIKEHHIRERYFKSGYTFNAFTLIPKNNMVIKKTANIDGEIGVFIAAPQPTDLAELNQLFGTNLVADSTGKISTDITAHKA